MMLCIVICMVHSHNTLNIGCICIWATARANVREVWTPLLLMWQYSWHILVYRDMLFDPSYVNVTLCVTLELATWQCHLWGKWDPSSHPSKLGCRNVKSKDLCLVQLCSHIQCYINGWKMLFYNRILWEVSLASVTLALAVNSKQQK